MDMQYLETQWFNLLRQFTTDQSVIAHLFRTLKTLYSEPHRSYHTPAHIESMLRLAAVYQPLIEEPQILYLAVWYHDIIYRVKEKNNEFQSARFAERELAPLNLSPLIIQKVSAYILATQSHQLPPGMDSFDCRLFLDLDLAVLGSEQAIYKEYCSGIRNEYAVFPDDVYFPKRIEVLYHFLNKERIFLTAELYDRLESRARKNIRDEITWHAAG